MAALDIRQLARALGGDVIGCHQVVAPGPGHSASDRSLSITMTPENADGFIVHSFAGDDWKTCREHVLRLAGIEPGCIGETLDRPPSPATNTPKRDLALSIWREAVDSHDTPVETYLASRGLSLPSRAAGAAIRFHRACPFRLEHRQTVHLPVMIGLMRDVVSDEPTGIHRTALAPDGRSKAELPGLGNPKKMLGSSRHAAVKLDPDEVVSDGLHVAEGIETVLACAVMGFRPIWACLSAGNIRTLPVLPGIEALTIFADHDASGTGQDAARDCASRWRRAGREARILLPPRCGADFADKEELDAHT